ncbi:HEAT repeat domain-containing protein [Calothrix sp. UHCC 0171]|uniref:HEAT repeat domain-containing protein n=1 Tax=Calothrix sp. UHCC 0171 TaxID=3110245 RepID=UPI002B1F4C7D|nr:HEAT repeat domain-containing protein [Calothrix sp. UHCC 0171]MEA5574201.1 HEAT repeat domain-containing protein [Calothrix sp. UHCC 0171]
MPPVLKIEPSWADSATHLHIQQLQQGTPEQRQQAVKSLVNIGKPAVSSLIQALEHQTPEVRAHAANALSQMGDDAAPALPALSKALQDEDKNVRTEAARAFNSIGRRAMVPYLVANLRHENPSVRYSAVHALTRLGKYAQSAVPTLVHTLQNDQETWVRLTAASALGGIGVNAVESLPALVGGLEDRDISVRHNAAYALGAIALSFQEQGNQVSSSDLDKIIPHFETALKVMQKPNWKFREQAITSISVPLAALKKVQGQRFKKNSLFYFFPWFSVIANN